MDFMELLKLSVSNLFSYKVRSFLTMLGIIIGISSVVMMSSLGAGVKENITGDLNKLGVSNFEISIDTSPGQTYKSQDLLTQKDIAELKNMEGVEAVTPTSSTFARLSTNDGSDKMFTGTGVTEDYFKMSNYTIVKGRKFLPNEYRKDGRYVIIDNTTADQMFPDENPIGKKLTLNFRKNSETVTIVGVFKNPYSSMGGGDQMPSMGLLPNNYLNYLEGNEQDKFTALQVKATDANEMSRVMEIVKEKTGEEPLAIFTKAIDNIKPVVEVKSRRVGGATYQVPTDVPEARREALAMRWIIGAARNRSGKGMDERLAAEVLDAYNNTGNAFKKREEVHRMAEANKAFSHFRF